MPTAPEKDGLTRTVEENLRALLEHRAKLARKESVHERLASRLAQVAGTMQLAYVHAVLVAGWLAWNSVPGLPHWDPYPFVMLAMAASVEAIFLSTFVLVSQNRMQKIADHRADLDLQINLLSEKEITRVLALVSEIARRMGIDEQPEDVRSLQRDVSPGEILDRIDDADEEIENGQQRDAVPHLRGHARGRA